MDKRWLILILPLVFMLNACGATSPTYKLAVTVSFLTATEDTNPNLPQNDGTVFLCNPAGQTYKATDLTGQPEMISIMDSPWSGSSLEIYGSTNVLIGVADSATPSILSDGSCQVQFLYSNLKLVDAPIKLETSGGSEWDIPESQWKTGVVLVNGSGSKF